MPYRTVQWSWFPLWVGLLLGSIQVIVLVGLHRSGELTTWIAVLTTLLSLVIFLVVLAFGRLVIEVDSAASASFGFGWPARTIALSDITSVGTVRNSWWYGWGIRVIPNGSMYNTWGTDAVEVGLASGKVFRFGTADPEGLAAAISLRTGLPVAPRDV